MLGVQVDVRALIKATVDARPLSGHQDVDRLARPFNDPRVLRVERDSQPPRSRVSRDTTVAEVDTEQIAVRSRRQRRQVTINAAG